MVLELNNKFSVLVPNIFGNFGTKFEISRFSTIFTENFWN